MIRMGGMGFNDLDWDIVVWDCALHKLAEMCALFEGCF